MLAPGDAEVYRPGHATWVEVGAVAEPLEGRCRPGHFRGVATIVLKLFNMVQPDAAYFGQKDYQQAAVIRRMVADLDVPVEIRVCPIVREPDGLAMSSRNVYLRPDARQRAIVLWHSLELARQLVARGERDAAGIVRQMTERILAAGATIDYVALVDPDSLAAVARITGPTLAALAVKIDGTRLIDNAILTRNSYPVHRHAANALLYPLRTLWPAGLRLRPPPGRVGRGQRGPAGVAGPPPRLQRRYPRLCAGAWRCSGLAIAFVLPLLCEPRGLPIRGYGMMMLLAVLSGMGLAAYRARRVGVDPEMIFTLAFWMILPGILGARAVYVCEYWFRDSGRVYAGMRSWGLALCRRQHCRRRAGRLRLIFRAMLGLGLFWWRHRVPLLATADLIAPSLLLGLALGRVGCLLNGCCYGGPCDLPWGDFSLEQPCPPA